MELLKRTEFKPSKSPINMRKTIFTPLFLFFFIATIPNFSFACMDDGDCRLGETASRGKSVQVEFVILQLKTVRRNQLKGNLSPARLGIEQSSG